MTDAALTEAMYDALGYNPCPTAEAWARIIALDSAAGTHRDDVDLCSDAHEETNK